MAFYGLYSASTASQSGCVFTFLSRARDDLLFPPQVQYDCPLCKDVHGFRYLRSFVATTPGQQRSLQELCVDRKWTQDVIIAS